MTSAYLKVCLSCFVLIYIATYRLISTLKARLVGVYYPLGGGTNIMQRLLVTLMDGEYAEGGLGRFDTLPGDIQ